MTYEYTCTICKHSWEEEQRIVDDPVKICPKCQQQSAKRLISLSSFILEGSGWARDNYK